MKKPVLIIGILFFILFLYDLKKRGIFFGRWDKVQATSCRSALVMLNKRIPSTWSTLCDSNNMTVNIKTEIPKNILGNNKKIKIFLYRELANNLIFIAKNCLNESLERVLIVRVTLQSQSMNIEAITEGKFIAKLATMKNENFIAQHLKATVQVKEILK